MKRRVNRHIAWLLCAALGGVCCFSGCGAPRDDEILVMHAASLSSAFREMAAAFEDANPGTRVVREAVGSKAGVRKLTDLGRRCDVFVSADSELIDAMLIPSHASWNISFARNAMCLAYREGSARSNEISAENWLEVLADEAVRFGLCDPDSAPCGYRTLQVIALGGGLDGQAGSSYKVVNKSALNERPKESDLLALLETGAVDYAMVYRSTAVQHGLKYVELPNEINLSDAALAEAYGVVQVLVAGARPGEVMFEVGRPIVYGVTIPKNAHHASLALKFVAFMLDKDSGMAIIERNGLIPAAPSTTRRFSELPEGLKAFAVPAGPKEDS